MMEGKEFFLCVLCSCEGRSEVTIESITQTDSREGQATAQFMSVFVNVKFAAKQSVEIN